MPPTAAHSDNTKLRRIPPGLGGIGIGSSCGGSEIPDWQGLEEGLQNPVVQVYTRLGELENRSGGTQEVDRSARPLQKLAFNAGVTPGIPGHGAS